MDFYRLQRHISTVVSAKTSGNTCRLNCFEFRVGTVGVRWGGGCCSLTRPSAFQQDHNKEAAPESWRLRAVFSPVYTGQ